MAVSIAEDGGERLDTQYEGHVVSAHRVRLEVANLEHA